MESIWRKYSEMPTFPEFSGNHRTDVLIIGGGLAGILTAYMLKKNGIDCILLEKGRICGGTSGNTTAKITYQHGLIYSNLLKNEGFHTAEKYLEANLMAFRKYEEICKNIECDFEYKDSYIYSLNNRNKLENELSALNRIGCEPELCEEIPLPFKTVGAVKLKEQAQFNPLKFISVISENLPVYENSFVREMKGNTAVTDKGKVIADNVVCATHFPFLNKHGSYFVKLYQSRSYVIALENAQDVNGIYLDESGTGFSFRNYKNYLLIGGGSHRTGKSGGGWNELRNFAKLHYPKAKECCYWAAQDCMSLDKMPYIGKYSNRTRNFYAAAGFNKWGMTGSMLASVLLTDMILGNQNEYIGVFSPSRNIMKPQLMVNAFESTKGLLTPSLKRCPHLGCALKWNSAEHSWDCPCHGSRFDHSGTLLDNPANGNLNK
ncbi:MAG: FAD-dependent oxidoreductase [Ruminococcus sp.]